MGLLYQRLIQQGWDRTIISEFILQATARAENKSTSPPTTIASNADVIKDAVFLHFQFHKDRISQQEIRKEFELHLEKICKEELYKERMIVTFSRPKNIGDFDTRAKLHQSPDKSASTILGEFRQGFNSY